MKNHTVIKYQKKIFTIPNLISLFRLCLIPMIVWLYSFKQDQLWTMVILLLSGATDIIDGMIARKLNMVSDFGKAFDPVADKLTQIAMLFCLVSRFPHMVIPLVILIIKEIIAVVINLFTIKKTSVVMGAVWHGKLTTVLLYSMIIIHLIWYNIPMITSDILIVICSVMMLISAVLYTVRSFKFLSNTKK